MAVLTLFEVEQAVRASWSNDTCDPTAIANWKPDNPAWGQCGTTALVNPGFPQAANAAQGRWRPSTIHSHSREAVILLMRTGETHTANAARLAPELGGALSSPSRSGECFCAFLC